MSARFQWKSLRSLQGQGQGQHPDLLTSFKTQPHPTKGLSSLLEVEQNHGGTAETPGMKPLLSKGCRDLSPRGSSVLSERPGASESPCPRAQQSRQPPTRGPLTITFTPRKELRFPLAASPGPDFNGLIKESRQCT